MLQGRRTSPAVLMAAGTAASRVTGFARTAALATVLGLSSLADAYNAAAALPTMLLVLVTGGTLSSALVPLLVRAETAEQRRRVAGSVLMLVGTVTAVATVLLAVSSTPVARLLSVSVPAGQREQRSALLADFLLLFSPQLFLLGLSVVASAILTSEGRLARVGITPVLTNLVTLLGIGLYVLLPGSASAAEITRIGLLVLGGCSTLGVAVTTTVQLRGCRDLLPEWRALTRDLDRGPFKELARVSRWSLVYVAANQIGLVVVLIAAGRSIGVLSAYQWAFAVMQLPYAILAVSALSASYPAMTRAADDLPSFDGVVRRSVGLLLLLLLPAAAAMALFADVIAAGLLGFGAAQRDVTLLTAGVRIYSLALVPFAIFQLLNRISYARREPRSPALSNLAVNGVLICGGWLAARSDSAPGLLQGLVVAYALSYVVGCAVLLGLLGPSGRGVLRPERGLVTGALPALLAVAAAWPLRLIGEAPWVDVAAALVVAGGFAMTLRMALKARAAQHAGETTA